MPVVNCQTGRYIGGTELLDDICNTIAVGISKCNEPTVAGSLAEPPDFLRIALRNINVAVVTDSQMPDFA